MEGDDDGPTTEAIILTDDKLTDAQKQSMLDVYRAFLAANDAVLPDA